MEAALIIFIKNPQLGRCKTRLAKTIGDKEALSVYMKLLDYTRSVAMATNCKAYLYYDQYIDADDSWDANHFTKKIQQQGDLGYKMTQAFAEVLKDHNKAVIIGSDCPEIKPSHINEAIIALENKDVVIGPSHDGGYYLLGMQKNHTELFKNIPWSTETVMDDTLSKITTLGLDYKLIEKLYDLDDENDLNRFPAFIP